LDWTAITSVISAIALVALFISAIVAIRQLAILHEGHRLNTAPFVVLGIEESVTQIPSSAANTEKHIIEIEELSEWAKANAGAAHRYMVLRLHNKQEHLAGVASDVRFRIVFKFPKYRTPNTMIEVARRVKGEIWLESGEVFRIIFADLRGVPTAVIDIDNIEYYDVDGNKYKRSYGYCHWELDNSGQESWDLRVCSR